MKIMTVMHQKSVQTLVQSLCIFFQTIVIHSQWRVSIPGLSFVSQHIRNPCHAHQSRLYLPISRPWMHTLVHLEKATPINTTHLMNEEQSKFNFTHLHNWFNVSLRMYWVPNYIHMWWFKDFFFPLFTFYPYIWSGSFQLFKVLCIL